MDDSSEEEPPVSLEREIAAPPEPPRSQLLTSKSVVKAAQIRRRQQLRQSTLRTRGTLEIAVPEPLPLQPQKTAFRIRELLDTAAALASGEKDAVFELWARVHSSVRRTRGEQVFEIADIVDPQPPYVSGLLEG
jgi:hypothetical protein